jgi:hypothetical protein
MSSMEEWVLAKRSKTRSAEAAEPKVARRSLRGVGPSNLTTRRRRSLPSRSGLQIDASKGWVKARACTSRSDEDTAHEAAEKHRRARSPW